MSNSRLLFALITLCSACGGSSFVASGTDAGGTSAEAGATGSHGGDTSSAGASSGGSGAESSAGSSGQAAGGAATAGAGGSSAGGTSAGGSSAGAGTGGSHAGAGGSSGGSHAGAGGSAGGGGDCTTLKADYAAALEKARACDMGSVDQCDKSSTLPNLGCGCPTLVNAKSAATTLAKQKYQAFQDAKCPVGPICAIACIAYVGAACSAQTTGTAFVCSGSNLATAN
ncbi:MAG TPA: hypothetical protein VIK01_19385 [Polyangiaceae bacterium]